MLELSAGEFRLVLSPERGGSILRLDWRGQPLMRPAQGPSILDVACFPLVPFCNRIANGRFAWNDRHVCLSPNMPGSDHPHPLHGFGWLLPWSLKSAEATYAEMELHYSGREWPWPFRAVQGFALDDLGLTLTLALTNLGDDPMPAGLGWHPYFPRNCETIYHGLHRGEWRNDADCLPLSLDEREVARDWWEGGRVGSRKVDTVYIGRRGNLTIDWPDLEMGLALMPSPELEHTVMYIPPSETWFCVEPVSHSTDALNRNAMASGIKSLASKETFAVALRLEMQSTQCKPRQ